MKHTIFSPMVVATSVLLSQQVQSQTSTVEYQTNAAIEVQTGADVSADNIITNSNYSGGGTFNGGPLPVEMAEMTVQAAKNTATIAWSTASETDNFGFEIERRVMKEMDDGRWMMRWEHG